MDYYHAIVLGLLQGATEFLPVSSSGHLAILSHISRMPEQARLGLAAALHAGTAVSLLVFFGRRIAAIARDAVRRERAVRNASWRYIGKITLATVPAVLVGLLLLPLIDRAFATMLVVGAMLLVTGTLLLITRLRTEAARPLGWMRALAIGAAQAFAILPGISRSGVTIAAGLLLGLSRREAFEFSFIMSVPIVIVAALRELLRLDRQILAPGPVALGILLAFAAGLGALVLLRRAVLGRRFYLFGIYCWLAGLAVIALLR
ncbi:MAG TPA: undecaprenyl-diphosphate phosphatase [candidate division WOR-3 bacterium]|uniref:Undecaprenyl-diphosphatase n=1 Tax=candidate division WOR-3 bacterium TaxID=2052148 RepID=A0A7V0T6H8_UNCW3|nr:undecaprenyl-diphosphate phosphatase [candidate division WOR-3 bacterium]